MLSFFRPTNFLAAPVHQACLSSKRSLIVYLLFSNATQFLLNCAVPATPGGGTVFFVTPGAGRVRYPNTDLLTERHRYLQNFEEREEGGTPDIVGAIRCCTHVPVLRALML